ncbi:MAG TPA: HAD family hydrolase [Candidatus Hydrogenedentes bacterium]|nr:HAD family hydrolase [Candidatus Hydrogenedentota bacterium]
MANLLVCDLDGTLLRRGAPISESTISVMKALRARGDIVAIATGRSLYSGYPVLPQDLPLDYWIFSTGVGILNWTTGDIERSRQLDAGQVDTIIRILTATEVDFMIQAPVPDNHRFAYRRFQNPANVGTDFERRVAHYKFFSYELAPGETLPQASQAIAILPPDLERFQNLCELLADFSVVRATSPFDGHSIWMEIFAPGVNKAEGAAWLAGRQDLGITTTYALGNDYNDLDLLEWADYAMLAAASPPELKQRFPYTQADTEDALAEAVATWRLLP